MAGQFLHGAVAVHGLIVEAVELLRDARSMIEDQDCWCRAWAACDDEGKPVSLTGGNATKYCAYGAFQVALYNAGPDGGNEIEYGPVGKKAWETLMHEAHMIEDGQAISHWMNPVVRVNEDWGYDAVIEMYDRAIDYLEKR